MKDLVYIGYISGPFGLKGELKIISDSNHLDKLLKVDNKLIINDKEYRIIKYHFHKHHLVTFEGFEDINLINDLIKKDVYISRANFELDDNEYLIGDLINCKIIEGDIEYGYVTDVLYNKNTIFLKSNDLIIPINKKYIEKIDTTEKIIYGKNLKELQL